MIVEFQLKWKCYFLKYKYNKYLDTDQILREKIIKNVIL